MIIRLESSNSTLTGFSKYTWAKYVEVFDDTNHCAKCLKGKWPQVINEKMVANQDIILPLDEGKPFYICGVAYPWSYHNNMHLAVIGKIGSESRLELYTGDVLLVKDAERYLFDDKAARELYPEYSEEYLTCRCFQFGAQLFGKHS
jgi:uncharacterized protein (DUF779 family)